MTSTTMHFGPEWMRTKHQAPVRSQPPPSPPPSGAPTSGASTYSALVSPAPPPQPEKRDEAHPFRYSKEELLRIYREGGGKGGLGLEVERWEGVVREVGSEPVGLREMGDSEKKLFQGPLNSDLRRRQSTDYLSPLSTQSLGVDRSRLNLHSPSSATASPLRERFGALRRRDSTDPPTVVIPRKQSLSSLQAPLASPREATLPSPRRGSGYTPSFDGILSSGDSWVARRRASEASLKSGAGPSRDGGGDTPQDVKTSEIREEEEDPNQLPIRNMRLDESHQNSAIGSQADGKESALPEVQGLGAHQSPGINGTTTPGSLGGSVSNAGTPDLAAVEWSYKDPQGQIQGPFQAQLMQKWFDDGYFSADLPMKRTHLDSQWVTVEELVKLHGSSKIFLSPPPPIIPPGISHRTESPQSFALPQDQHLFGVPFQPAPIRNLRSSTLDSYGSNPSDSPSSSFGAGRFGNGSPDPNAFGGRGTYFGDNTVNVRAPSFSGIPDPTVAFHRRNTFNDPSLDSSLGRTPSQASNIPGRGPISDSYGYNRAYAPGQAGWPINNAGVPFDNGTRGSVDPSAFPANFAPGSANNFGNLVGSQDNIYSDGIPFQSLDYNHYINGQTQNQHYSHSPATQYASTQHLQQSAPTSSAPYNQHGTAPLASVQVNQLLNQNPAPSQSPWNNGGSVARRPGPFEVSHPTSNNTMVLQPVVLAETSPWGHTNQPSRPTSQANESSPWVTPSQGALEALKDVPAPDSLTFSNVGQHNEQQQQSSVSAETVTNHVELSDQPHVISLTEPVAPPDAAAKAIPSTKPKSKPSTPAIQPSVPKTMPVTRISPESTPTSTMKAAWLKEDETKKVKPSGVSVSLREIQEAEAKKSEARKAAERERERTARAATPATDGAQPFTASWGLPTSQAGTRAAIPIKDVNASTGPVTPPVWTTAVKPVTTKKTMKEIQEEEEKRKKTAVRETTASAAARRAYAETTQKVAAPVPGSAWTTVGASGKPSAVTAPVRPIATPSVSTLSIPSSSVRTNGNTVPRPIATSPVKTIPVTAKNEDPVSPSHDFLKWLSGSLKGLNNTVNVEEIMSMLLSFPMDPDPSTIEIISELVYANSTTLDGRRFAAEFIAKRKADASSRPKGAATTGKATAKPVSIADVVKATPKPTQPEWGFKVVNKKKKSGRA